MTLLEYLKSMFNYYLLFRLYQIKLGTLENESASDTEWSMRPYMNTARKKRFLSDEDGWEIQT